MSPGGEVMKIVIPARPETVTLDTERSAVVVVDMQNAFCKKGGMMDVMGGLDQTKANCVIDNNGKVIAAARRAGIKVVYLRMAYRADLSNFGGPDSPNYWKQKGVASELGRRREFLTIGTWDWQIADELTPQPGDIVVDKNRFSGFVNTELDVVLRTLKAKHLLFVGIATNVCVESTVRDAFFHEYFPVLVGDACGEIGPDFIQQATLWNVARFFGWVTTTEEFLGAMVSSGR
jgi:ureidoacrylate peracid hydrolase